MRASSRARSTDVTDPYFPALTGIRARKGGPGRRSRGLVLLYHRVHDARDVHGLNVTAGELDGHLEWLGRACTVVPLEHLLESPDTDLPDRAVALTFDDGYEDNLQAAVPVLERYGAPATFFATTRWLDGPGEYWWDALERILLGSVPVPASLELTVRGNVLRLSTRSAEERLAAHWRLHPALVHATLAERDELIAALEAWGGGSPPRYRPMDADALRALAGRPGMAIGAHSVTHLALPDQSADVSLREIVASRDQLAALVGRPVHCFAYPYGAVDRSAARLVRSQMRWGLSCEEAAVASSCDAARVPRLDVKAWSVEEFADRVGRLLEGRRGSARPAT